MNDLMMELQTEANCINGVISRILLFHYGMLFDDQLYISSFISGAVYKLESVEILFSICQLTESARVIFFSPFISCGSSLDIGYMKKRNY